MRYDCSINITRKTHFVHIYDTVADISFSCPFFQLPTVKLFEVLAHYARRRFLHSIHSSIDNVLLQTNTGSNSHFLTLQTFLNFIW